MDKEALLTNYFSNRLSQEEKSQFDKLLDSDEEFKAQFDFEKNLQRAIKDKENQLVKAKLITFEKDISERPKESITKKSYRNLAIAASIALLIGLGWVGYLEGSSDQFEDLYAANFQEYPGETAESVERDAFVAYESRKYDTAIEGFHKIPSEVKQPYIDFYLAQSYLNVGRNEQAKEYFRKIIAKSGDFTGESHWYLAMIALKEKNKAEAKFELEKLTNGHDYNTTKAVDLLKELD